MNDSLGDFSVRIRRRAGAFADVRHDFAYRVALQRLMASGAGRAFVLPRSGGKLVQTGNFFAVHGLTSGCVYRA
jgi:hypothetical protein